MSSTSGSNSGTGGTQRASEINNAMLNVPGYADDSLLFMMRYGNMAKETLRKVDWDEFQRRLHAMNAHWAESKRKSQSQTQSNSSSAAVVGCRGTGEGDGANTAASRHVKDSPPTGEDDNAVDPPPEPETETEPEAAELKARTLELVQDFPHLVRDFDRFVECTRMMAARYKR